MGWMGWDSFVSVKKQQDVSTVQQLTLFSIIKG
jgi:hypothetical protein